MGRGEEHACRCTRLARAVIEEIERELGIAAVDRCALRRDDLGKIGCRDTAGVGDALAIDRPGQVREKP
jgi:hypothetical protein